MSHREVLDNILTKREIEELAKEDKPLELVAFESFFGTDGELYYGGGKTLQPEDYQVIGAMAFAAPRKTDNEILARAIEYRRTKGSNAYVLNYELSVDQDFSLKQHEQGLESNNHFSILSVVYIKADEEKLNELRD